MKIILLGAAIIIAMLSACKPEPEGPPKVQVGETAIACALGGAASFSYACTVEPSLAGSGSFLIVRHPDGAFRRFEVLKDGSGLVTADGAEQAMNSLAGELLEVAVGLDRYRFPATQIGNVVKP
ncbi:MAG: hypothetical protein N2423_03760 [Novosphingobium sp.]|nr:hypothetical protein [Novosphingobium sp.]